MARTKGTFNISANIETNASAPLDARERVATLADLTAQASFPYFYQGMQVYVVSEQKRYTLIGDNPTVLSNWQENGSNFGIVFNDVQQQKDQNNNFNLNEEDPTVPEWAKSQNKPTYTAEEIDAVGVDDQMTLAEIDALFEAVFG